MGLIAVEKIVNEKIESQKPEKSKALFEGDQTFKVITVKLNLSAFYIHNNSADITKADTYNRSITVLMEEFNISINLRNLSLQVSNIKPSKNDPPNSFI
jgi:hypothetical protein